MCDCQSTGGVTRREAIAGALVLGSAVAIGAGVRSTARAVAPAIPAVEVLPGLAIHPRDAWGADLPPTGPIAVETPQFLLVHHTASSNAYSSAAGLIQATYAFHTSAAKGWSDVCYQFFIGRDGDVWEGRAGALTGPVMADATGGSQGFAQLICMIGDFGIQRPTPAALDVARQGPCVVVGPIRHRHQPRRLHIVRLPRFATLVGRDPGDHSDHRRSSRHVVYGVPWRRPVPDAARDPHSRDLPAGGVADGREAGATPRRGRSLACPR